MGSATDALERLALRLLAGVALWLALLGVLDMRFVDRWEAALWLLLIAGWLAIEMIRLAVGRRGRK